MKRYHYDFLKSINLNENTEISEFNLINLIINKFCFKNIKNSSYIIISTELQKLLINDKFITKDKLMFNFKELKIIIKNYEVNYVSATDIYTDNIVTDIYVKN